MSNKITILSNSKKFFWLEVDKVPIKGIFFSRFEDAKSWINKEYDRMRNWWNSSYLRSSENIQRRRRDGNP